jgi:hypothetical protein
MVLTNSNLAPIAFFAYKRPDHTRRTLEALSANELASESELFIFSDGPRNERDEQGVLAVREYIRTTKGFKSVNIIEREKNQGLAKSLISGITELCDKFGRAIVVEDDILTSPFFLRFMNDALDQYENNHEVFSICAFWPLKPILGDDMAFFINLTSSWGWATWKRAWDFYDYKAAGWEELKQNKRMAWDFDLQGRFNYTSMLMSQVQKDINSWAIQWYWLTYRKKKLCLFPPHSLVTNIGFDSLGDHTTSPEERWITQNIDLNIDKQLKLPSQIILNESKRSRLGEFYYSYKKNRPGFSLRGLLGTLNTSFRRTLRNQNGIRP